MLRYLDERISILKIFSFEIMVTGFVFYKKSPSDSIQTVTIDSVLIHYTFIYIEIEIPAIFIKSSFNFVLFFSLHKVLCSKMHYPLYYFIFVLVHCMCHLYSIRGFKILINTLIKINLDFTAI